MPRLKIGIRVECLRLPVKEAIRKAAELGADAVQVDASGELAPQNLSATGRRDFKHVLRSLGLELAAVGFPTRRGYAVADQLDTRIEQTKKVLSLSYELGGPIVVNHVGRVPQDVDDEGRKLLVASLIDIGRHAERVGAIFAAETGSEAGPVLRGLLDSLGVGGVGVNLDPAGLLLNGFDVLEAVRALGPLIVHTHARDGRYSQAAAAGREVPLGQGDLDWQAYLAALEEVDYRGYLTIERESGDDPVADVAHAVKFLKQF